MYHVKRSAHKFASEAKTHWINPFRKWHPFSSPGSSTEALNPPATPPSPLSPGEASSKPDESSKTETDGAGQSAAQPSSHGLNFLRRRKTTDIEANRTNTDASKSSKKNKKKFGFWRQIETIFFSWINVLLVCAPVGIGLGAANANGYAVFIVNFIAILPLAGLLSYSTEQISVRTGETLGGLLNASFGNAVELIVSIIALAQNQIIIVQTSLIGSMLSNLLLVLGMCFFAGGVNRPNQNFNVDVAQTSASLLSIAVASLIIPTTFYRWGTPDTPQSDQERQSRVPALSRGIAVILLVVYGCYLFFQLKTHRSLFKETGEKVPTRKESKELPKGRAKQGIIASTVGAMRPGFGDENMYENKSFVDPKPKMEDNNDDDEEEAEISVTAAVLTLLIATALIGACSEYMVDGIAYVVKQGGISPEFIGLILIPIVGNAAEHATAVTVAIKDKMDLAIGVAIGSSLQIALFVLPVVVIVGWGLQNSMMTLEFDGFLIALLFVAMLLVNYLIQDGSSHWLEGVQLMCLYVMIAVAAWFYPQKESVVG